MTASYNTEITYFGQWCCYFLVDGHPDTDQSGPSGTGCKIYGCREKAENAGKRYLRKMKKNGFDV